MSDLELLTLDTVPSTWIHASYPPDIAPYRRIIGISGRLGSVACNFAVDKQQGPMELLVSADFARRLMDFFGRHIAAHDPEHPDSPEQPSQHRPLPLPRYNCHTFALAMLGQQTDNVSSAYMEVDARAQLYVPAQGNLPLGVHGLVRDPKSYHISHSVIGLGADVPLCLQE